MQLQYNPTTVVEDIYLREIKNDIHIKAYTQISIATLFVTTPNYKQWKIFFTDERLNKHYASMLGNTT